MSSNENEKNPECSDEITVARKQQTLMSNENTLNENSDCPTEPRRSSDGSSSENSKFPYTTSDDDSKKFDLVSPSLSRVSNHSVKSLYSESVIFGNLPQDEIDLERAKTREEILSRTTTRYIDDIVPKELGNGLLDDGEKAKDIDPELISWDNDEDPQNPRNWPQNKKWLAVGIVASFTFTSPFSSSIIAPAIPDMAADLHITKEIEKSLSVSIFVLAWAICPLFVAPLSEVFGRRTILTTATIVMTIFHMATALSKNVTQLLVFRFLAGCAGALPISIGAGTMADLFNDKERGAALALYALGPTVGPVVAPIISGFIVENTSWRWVVWVLTMFSGIIAAFGFIFYPETYAPVILKWKAAKLRKETGNHNLHTVFEINQAPFKKQLLTAVIRPVRLLFLHPIIQGLGLYMAFVYGFLYLLLVTFPTLWSVHYGFNLGITGLMYISLGVGFCTGLLFWSRVIQMTFIKLTKRNGGVSKPEYRLYMVPFSALFLSVGLFWYGWSAQARIFWIMPCIGAGIFTFGMIAVFQSIQNYLIDMNPRFAASSMAAAMVFRSMLGFGFPLFGKAMYDRMGYGWANSMTGLLCLVLGIPFPIIVIRYGEKIRLWANKRFV